jgi:S-adenosylmethionine synthetase
MAKKKFNIKKSPADTGILFTSESVTQGHPDKVADQISDAVLDAMLEQDPDSRVACETMVTTGLVIVSGEITSKAVVDIQAVTRKTIKDIGYTRPELGFDFENCAVITALNKQSPDIALGVDQGKGLYKKQGAGDQGIMFGYACNETKSYMPLSISLAHKITDQLTKLRKNNKISWLRPDGKSQVTIEKCPDGKSQRVHTVVVSTQHDPDVKRGELEKQIIEKVIKPCVPANLIDSKTIYHINPTGKFVIGGPKGDCGVTGRKIIVDTYGGHGSHGGGAFSGKDPSKVDRSASYMARYIAKNIVAAKLADSCEVQLSYAIGIAEPISVFVETNSTTKVSERELEAAVRELFPLTPHEIIDYLKLKRPIYENTARGGHFGRNLADFTWETTDMVTKLEEYFK